MLIFILQDNNRGKENDIILPGNRLLLRLLVSGTTQCSLQKMLRNPKKKKVLNGGGRFSPQQQGASNQQANNGPNWVFEWIPASKELSS